MLNEKIQTVIECAFEIDAQIAGINQQLAELESALQAEGRLHDVGFVRGVRLNTKDSFYRQVARRLQDMQRALNLS